MNTTIAKSKGAKSAKKQPSAGAGTDFALGEDAPPATPPATPPAVTREYATTFHAKFNLSLIAEDPDNARTDFERPGQDAFERAVAEKGVQQPLWIRLRPEGPDKNGATHVLIAGARRTRGAKKVGLLTVPAIEYHDLSQAEADELADLENCQRQDLSDPERALHYAKMVEKHGWQWWDEKDPSRSLGHRFVLGGKSSTYEWARLAKLPKLALEALASGELRSRSVAVKLASIGDPKRLQEALREAIDDGWTDKEAAERIQEGYLAELKGVSFDINDATLVPAAGSCEACPWRSGNQMDLAPEFRRRGDICTKPGCLRDKLRAQFEREAKEHETAGGKVWSEKEADKHGIRKDYAHLDNSHTNLGASGYLWQLNCDIGKKTLEEALKPAILSGQLKVILAFEPKTGATLRIAESDAVKAAGVRLGVIKKQKGRGPSDSEKKQREKIKEGAAIIDLQVTAIVNAAELKAKGASGGKSAFVWAHFALLKLSRNLDADKCRRIAKRRNLDATHFKLQGRGVWQREAVEIAVAEAVKKGDVESVAGWIAEITATPSYLHWEHPEKLDEESTAELLDYLGFSAKDLLLKAKADRKAQLEVKMKPAKAASPAKTGKPGKKAKGSEWDNLVSRAVVLRRLIGKAAFSVSRVEAYFFLTRDEATKLHDAAIDADAKLAMEGGAK